MRRTEALLIFLILAAVGISASFTGFQTLLDDRDTSGMTPEVPVLPDGLFATREPATDELAPIVEDEEADAHIFWMRDGWYYKKFDRFGNALTKERQIDADGVTEPFLSEKGVDIDSNQDINFVWAPGGYSDDVHYVRYVDSGVVIVDIPGVSTDDPQIVDDYEDNPRISRWFY
jgi:hypothetical protein